MPELTVCRECGLRFWSTSWSCCDYCRAWLLYDKGEDERADEEMEEAVAWEALLMAGEEVSFDDLCEEEA